MGKIVILTLGQAGPSITAVCEGGMLKLLYQALVYPADDNFCIFRASSAVVKFIGLHDASQSLE
jgi:hypothetical protein